MPDEITSQDVVLLVKVLTKIEENFLDRLSPDELKGFKKLQTVSDALLTDVEKAGKGGKAPNRTAYDTALKTASALLKDVSTRKTKPEVKQDAKPAKVEWEVTGFEDEGDCEAAAKASGAAVKKGFDRDKAKYLKRDIKEGDLGVLYETNLTTEGDKYSLFFKYVRQSEGKASMVGVAIGSHSGSGNKYYKVKKDGSKTKNQVSAMKKL